jgi:hypothetical protein
LGVGFGGGEPTLYPHLVELCHYAAQNTGLAVTLTIHHDALEKFLCSQELAFVWGVWGERRVANLEMLRTRKKTGSDYVDFQQVFLYKHGATCLVKAE